MGSIRSKGFLFQRAMDSYIILSLYFPQEYTVYTLVMPSKSTEVHRNPQDSRGKCYNLQEPAVIPEDPNFKHFDEEKDFFTILFNVW